MAVDFSRHPCFNAESRHEFGRVHLPVAPKCNVQCNFCDRKYDCANETRPGVTSTVLTPQEAIAYLDRFVAKRPDTAVVGIAGPGDPFANPDETMETLRLVREKYPEMILCLASNGLGILPYIDELAELEVSHVTITISAIDPEIGQGVYAWVRDGKMIRRGKEGAALILERQLAAIEKLKAKDIVVKVNTILIPDLNEKHVVDIAKKVKELGADILNMMPLYPVEGTPLGDREAPTGEQVKNLRAQASIFMPQMHHCTRCRADAAGLLGEDNKEEVALCVEEARKAAGDGRPYVAVASMEGLLVNRHLGEADRLWIFNQVEHGMELVEERKTPARGSGNER